MSGSSQIQQAVNQTFDPFQFARDNINEEPAKIRLVEPILGRLNDELDRNQWIPDLMGEIGAKQTCGYQLLGIPGMLRKCRSRKCALNHRRPFLQELHFGPNVRPAIVPYFLNNNYWVNARSARTGYHHTQAMLVHELLKFRACRSRTLPL